MFSLDYKAGMKEIALLNIQNNNNFYLKLSLTINTYFIIFQSHNHQISKDYTMPTSKSINSQYTYNDHFSNTTQTSNDTTSINDPLLK